MFIEEFTGVTSKQIRVEHNAAGFIITKSHATAAQLASETLRLVHSVNAKEKPIICKDAPLVMLAEFEGAKNGAYFESATITMFPVMITPDAVDVSGTDYLKFEFGDLDATATYKLYIIQPLEKMQSEPFHFEKVEIASGQTSKEFEIGDIDFLILPSSSLDGLELTYPDGRTVELDYTELSVAQLMANDIVKHSGTSGAVYGADTYLIVPVGLAIRAKVNCGSGGYVFYTKR